MHVGAECEGAVLDVEGKAEDLQVAGTDEPQHPVPADVTRVVDVHVGTCLGHIVIHADGETDEWMRDGRKRRGGGGKVN